MFYVLWALSNVKWFSPDKAPRVKSIRLKCVRLRFAIMKLRLIFWQCVPTISLTLLIRWYWDFVSNEWLYWVAANYQSVTVWQTNLIPKTFVEKSHSDTPQVPTCFIVCDLQICFHFTSLNMHYLHYVIHLDHFQESLIGFLRRLFLEISLHITTAQYNITHPSRMTYFPYSALIEINRHIYSIENLWIIYIKLFQHKRLKFISNIKKAETLICWVCFFLSGQRGFLFCLCF